MFESQHEYLSGAVSDHSFLGGSDCVCLSWSELFSYTSFNSKIGHEPRQQNTVMLKDRSTTLRTQVTTLCAILIRY